MTSDQEKTDHPPQVHTLQSHRHKVLMVDDETAMGKALARLLDRDNLEYLFVTSGEEALTALETSDTPFSLIISDQRMPGMMGTEFLAKAKAISPDTVRYLLTGYSEMETIINAVNKGAVQRYISKPWDNDNLRQIIREGIVLYEQHLESERLFALAKKQNARLYELNCELVENTKSLETKRKKLDHEIDALKAQLTGSADHSGYAPGRTIDRIAAWIKEKNGDEHQFSALRTRTLAALYDMFTDLAMRNGLEMPGIEFDSKNTEADNA